MKKEGQYKHFNNRLIKIAWLSILLLIVLPLLILPGGNVSAQEARIVGIEYPEVVTTGTEFDVTIEVEYSFPAEGALAIDGYLGEKEIFEDMREVVGSGVLPLTYTLIAPYEPGEYEYAIDVYIWLWEFEEWEWWDETIFFIIISKNEPPEAHAYDVPGGPAPYTAKFEGWGTDDGYITRVKWDFGAGIIVEKDFGIPAIKKPGMRYSLQAELIYTVPGTYKATFTVWDNGGKSDSIILTFRVYGKKDYIPPTANANGPYIGWEGNPIIFTSHSTPGMPSTFIKKSVWSPGNPHTWFDDYAGKVTLQVWDTLGQTSTATASVKVKNVKPLAFIAVKVPTSIPQFEFVRHRVKDVLNMNPSGLRTSMAFVGEGLVTNKQIEFEGSWIDPGTKDTFYTIWEWGDETKTTIPSKGMTAATATGEGKVTAHHTYSKAGKYTVSLTVFDDDGGKDTKTLAIPEVVDPNLETEWIGGDSNFKVDKHGLLVNIGVYAYRGTVRVNGIKVGFNLGVGFEFDGHTADGYIGATLGPITIKLKWPPW